MLFCRPGSPSILDSLNFKTLRWIGFGCTRVRFGFDLCFCCFLSLRLIVFGLLLLQVAEIVADCMHNYLLFESILQVHLIPVERVHPKL